jgi:beta-lactamase regulating signal transducer with metallopeptidase domain
MSSLFTLREFLFAGELFAGSALIMVAAWLAATHQAASVRHLAWLGAFGTALALPLFAAFMPSPFRILLAAPEPPPLSSLSNASIAPMPEIPAASGFSLEPSTIALALAALWLAGVCVVALRFAIGMACLASLKRRSRLFALAPDDLPQIASARRECELRLSNSEHGPVTWGIFRPVILLPKTAIFWPRERLHAVLLHELAHIRRRDSLAQALSLLVCALYWPNPLVWFAARRLRREAEIAADDAAIVSGIKPSAYAGELLQLATEFRTHAPAFSSLSMAAPSSLEARVKSVLAPTSLRSGVTSMDVMKISGIGLIAAAAIAFACPSLAQDEPATPPPPPSAVTSETLPPPDAPPALPARPAEMSVPTPPALPAPAELASPPPLPALAPLPSHVEIDTREMTKAQRAEMKKMRIEIEHAKREAHEAIERAKPDIERAERQARMSSEEAMRAVHEAQPQIDAAMVEVRKSRPEIEAALAKAQPEIDEALEKVRVELAKAHLDANVQVRVNEALKRAEIRIDAVKAREANRAERHEVHIEERTDTDEDSDDSSHDEN